MIKRRGSAASIPIPPVARYLGIPTSDLRYLSLGSIFDPRRRPLYYIPTTTVDRHMTEGQWRILVNRVDQIMEGRLDRKGIIHTRSYDRMHNIVARSKYRGQMLSHTTRTTRDVVERFRKSAAPSILVSPSLEEGWDFVGDQARYQILVKVPFMDISTAIIKARHRSDKTYINYLVAQSLIQTVGRGMRSERDWCENFILDDHFNWMWAVFKQQNLIPDWFKAAFHYAQTVPSPLRFYK